ncbi:MAG: lysophospholipid acyltransferase family protein [Bacillota bacterium]
MVKYYPLILEKLMRLSRLTYRIEEVNRERTDRATDEGGLILGWHCNLWILALCFAASGYTALASQSREGEIISQTLEKLGWDVIRGSNSAGAVSSLKKMLKLIKNQQRLVMTPDGPRGPARKIKLGAVLIQQRSGCPVVPVGVASKWKHVFTGSWDNFELPYFFSKVVVHYGDPIYDLEGLDREEAALVIEEALEQANQAARQRLGT